MFLNIAILSGIDGRMSPSHVSCSLDIVLNLFIMYNQISSNIVIIDFFLSLSITEVNDSYIPFSTALHAFPDAKNAIHH